MGPGPGGLRVAGPGLRCRLVGAGLGGPWIRLKTRSQGEEVG